MITGSLPVLQQGTSKAHVIKGMDAASGRDPVREAKLRQAAAEFESILLSTFWKSMKGSFAADGEDASDPAHESLEDWGIQAMSTAVGKAGGLGIGKLILKYLVGSGATGSTARGPNLSKPLASFADKKQ